MPVISDYLIPESRQDPDSVFLLSALAARALPQPILAGGFFLTNQIIRCFKISSTCPPSGAEAIQAGDIFIRNKAENLRGSVALRAGSLQGIKALLFPAVL
jgi:hypothetical protein